MAKQKPVKKFFDEVSIVPIEKGYGIFLDGKPLKTPASAILYTNSLRLVEAVTLEWTSQKDDIDLDKMPLFRLLATSIDRVASNRAEVNRITLSFGATDLLYYRAAQSEELKNRQERSWQPLIDWAEMSWGVSFSITDSLLPIKQPRETINVMDNMLLKFSDIEMTAVSTIAAATGSLIIALALEDGIISATLAFEISVLEQSYQIEKWGGDKFLTDQYNHIQQDIYEAYKVLELVK